MKTHQNGFFCQSAIRFIVSALLKYPFLWFFLHKKNWRNTRPPETISWHCYLLTASVVVYMTATNVSLTLPFSISPLRSSIWIWIDSVKTGVFKFPSNKVAVSTVTVQFCRCVLLCWLLRELQQMWPVKYSYNTFSSHLISYIKPCSLNYAKLWCILWHYLKHFSWNQF